MVVQDRVPHERLGKSLRIALVLAERNDPGGRGGGQPLVGSGDVLPRLARPPLHRAPHAEPGDEEHLIMTQSASRAVASRDEMQPLGRGSTGCSVIGLDQDFGWDAHGPGYM